jgi:DNA invertase Pin-like site-specific DNA recombinase
MTTYAYLRVSTDDQTTDNQRLEIENAGFKVDEVIAENGVSGSTSAFDRPAFKEMMKKLVKGDIVIVKAVDRVGRNAFDVLAVIEKFKEIGIGFRVMQIDGLDVTSPMGKGIMTILAAIAEMELNMIKERTKSGVARAKAEGKAVGKESKIDPDKVEEAAIMLKSGNYTQKAVAQFLNITERSLRRVAEDIRNNTEFFKASLLTRKEAFNKQRQAI